MSTDAGSTSSEELDPAAGRGRLARDADDARQWRRPPRPAGGERPRHRRGSGDHRLRRRRGAGRRPTAGDRPGRVARLARREGRSAGSDGRRLRACSPRTSWPPRRRTCNRWRCRRRPARQASKCLLRDLRDEIAETTAAGTRTARAPGPCALAHRDHDRHAERRLLLPAAPTRQRRRQRGGPPLGELGLARRLRRDVRRDLRRSRDRHARRRVRAPAIRPDRRRRNSPRRSSTGSRRPTSAGWRSTCATCRRRGSRRRRP